MFRLFGYPQAKEATQEGQCAFCVYEREGVRLTPEPGRPAECKSPYSDFESGPARFGPDSMNRLKVKRPLEPESRF